MYSYSKKNIIQDDLSVKKEIKPSFSEDFNKNCEVFFDNCNKGMTSFMGNVVAVTCFVGGALFEVGKCLCRNWLLILCSALYLYLVGTSFTYLFIQGCFALETGPAFILNMDKAQMPLLFHADQGHPIWLGIIWLLVAQTFVRAAWTGISFCCGRLLCDEESMMFFFIVDLICMTVFLCNMNNSLMYWLAGTICTLGILLFLGMFFQGGSPELPGIKVFDADGNMLFRIVK